MVTDTKIHIPSAQSIQYPHPIFHTSPNFHFYIYIYIYSNIINLFFLLRSSESPSFIHETDEESSKKGEKTEEEAKEEGDGERAGIFLQYPGCEQIIQAPPRPTIHHINSIGNSEGPVLKPLSENSTLGDDQALGADPKEGPGKNAAPEGVGVDEVGEEELTHADEDPEYVEPGAGADVVDEHAPQEGEDDVRQGVRRVEVAVRCLRQGHRRHYLLLHARGRVLCVVAMGSLIYCVMYLYQPKIITHTTRMEKKNWMFS